MADKARIAELEKELAKTRDMNARGDKAYQQVAAELKKATGA